MFAISQKVPVYAAKTLFAASGPFTLALAMALAGWPLWPRALAFVLLLAGAGHQLSIELPRREVDRWDYASRYLLAMHPRTPIFLADEGAAIAIDHYCRRSLNKAACPLDIRLVEPRRDWSFGLSPYPHMSLAEARKLATQGNYVTITWRAPRDQLDPIASRADAAGEKVKLGLAGWLVNWPAR